MELFSDDVKLSLYKTAYYGASSEPKHGRDHDSTGRNIGTFQRMNSK